VLANLRDKDIGSLPFLSRHHNDAEWGGHLTLRRYS
jgi:hypothetical protein